MIDGEPNRHKSQRHKSPPTWLRTSASARKHKDWQVFMGRPHSNSTVSEPLIALKSTCTNRLSCGLMVVRAARTAREPVPLGTPEFMKSKKAWKSQHGALRSELLAAAEDRMASSSSMATAKPRRARWWFGRNDFYNISTASLDEIIGKLRTERLNEVRWQAA